MVPERCPSIVDWLSDVEASVHLQESSTRDTSLSAPSLRKRKQKHRDTSLSAPPLTNLQHHPRKRKHKHHPDSPQPYPETIHSDRRTRKPLCEIMQPNSTKRRRTDTTSENEEQDFAFEHDPTQTPQKGQSSSSSQSLLRTPTASLSSQSNPKTPSSARKRGPPTLAKNAENIRDTLESHGMWYDDVEAFDRCPDMKEKVAEIITHVRGSEMGDSSVKKVLAAVRKNYTKNEKTHFNKVRPLVIKVTRSVIDQDSESGEGNGAVEFLKREFEKDGLEMVENANFTRRLLPLPDSVTSDKAMGLTEPNPDFTFGIVKPKPFPDAEVHVPEEIKAYLGVAPSMRFPFYVEEYKSAEQGIVKAEHQAMRDGAVLVNARIKLNEALKPASWVRPTGADLDSFVFSCAWTPYMAEMFVNWYEKLPNGKEVFHTTMVGDSYRMNNGDDTKRLRHDIENILDWGLLKHRWRAQHVWEEIVAYYSGLNAS